MSAALSVTDAVKTYPGAPAPTLDRVNLQVEAGEAFIVLGHTGSGKSTLLRAIAGLDELNSGTIAMADDGRLSVVFQRPGLFPWLNVRENIELGARYAANKGRVDPEYVTGLLRTLGLSELENRRVDEISGGQAQRVAIGRALAIRPSVLLLDEPFSALDPVTREELQGWLRGLIDELGLTVFMVSHDIHEAVTVGDRIGFFEAGAGFTRFWEPAAGNVSEAEILEHYRATGSRTSRESHV